MMSDEEIRATSTLFSEHYGIWSNSCARHGQHVRFTTSMIKESFVNKEDRYVAMVFHHGDLIGHAFYMRRNVPKVGIITWILQLVVREDFRGQHIGAKLMHSIWGLSDSFACGLFTSNPITIKALELATFRHVEVDRIDKNLNKIKLAAGDIFPNSDWIDNYHNGKVNTEFYVDHSKIAELIDLSYGTSSAFPLDKSLPDGYEWLAFTFKSQKPFIDNPEQLQVLMDYSNEVIFEAYSKMNLTAQSWSKHTPQEVELISRWIPDNCRILDLGCGQGRHTIALAEKGYNVVGIDYSKKNIDIANERNTTNAIFLYSDARKYKAKQKYDAVICLYDVVGSFPKEKDNYRILKAAYRSLKMGGILIMSVMNMGLTYKRCKKAGNIVESMNDGIEKLLMLDATNTMQKTGDVFNGTSILIDKTTGICYRKEQFFTEDELPKVYIVRDRRYGFRGISKLVEKAGFVVEEKYFFSAKDINTLINADSKHAKEILLVAKKGNGLRRLLLSKERAWE